ncbi:MAG: BlaI/MecI/CopY family transcriptional regulator [Xanthomonadales bacterium]|nr:BlaI/MecI/CopY family transcriptional regulator [Xanthomonadales bacterium]
MTRKDLYTHLSRRETQIMDAIYRLGSGGVQEVLAEMTDPPGYNSVRVILGILEEKGYLTHKKRGKRYIYYPRQSASSAGRKATRQLLRTFFPDSTPSAVATLLDVSEKNLSDDDLAELENLISEAKARRNKRK